MSSTCLRPAVTPLLLFLVATAATAQTSPAETCFECHGSDGMGVGQPLIPVIAGMPAGHIEEAIYAYVDGIRRCAHEPRMCETVSSLPEDAISEIAAYFAARPRSSSNEPFDESLATKGMALHTEHCAICHLRPDDSNVEFGLGIPLHGQRKDYLRYAVSSYFNGNREALLVPMALELQELGDSNVEALIEYYASYRPNEE